MTIKGANQAQRRLQVRLSVLAGSAVTLAASWLGVVYADRASADAPAAAALAPFEGVSPAALGTQLGAGGPATTPALVPVPATTRQTVVVRRSRAS